MHVDACIYICMHFVDRLFRRYMETYSVLKILKVGTCRAIRWRFYTKLPTRAIKNNYVMCEMKIIESSHNKCITKSG